MKARHVQLVRAHLGPAQALSRLDTDVVGNQPADTDAALLFDLDGVLADVEDSYRRCVIETVAAFGVSISRAELEVAVMEGEANNDWVLSQLSLIHI